MNLIPLLSVPLPVDIQNIILEYTGFHKLRNGKYMKQLTKRRLRKMNTKIKYMPRKKNGCVSLTMFKDNNRCLEYIIIGPSFYYSGRGSRL
jgi:hypothetical protein